MSDEKCVVISTHQVRDIDRMLDHVVIIDGSRVLLDQSVADICRTLVSGRAVAANWWGRHFMLCLR